MNKEFQEQLIGDIVGLRAALKATLAVTALLAKEQGKDFLRLVQTTAIDQAAKDIVPADGLDQTHIKTRAEYVIDSLFSGEMTPIQKNNAG